MNKQFSAKIRQNRNAIWNFDSLSICLPEIPLNTWQDGGHLILVPHRHISDRVEYNPREAIEMVAASMLAGQALLDVFHVEKINYQEMGNWGLSKTEKPKLHLHIFGRSRQQTYQIRGESIRFFPQGHPIYQKIYQPLSEKLLADIRQSFEINISLESIKKLLKMASSC